MDFSLLKKKILAFNKARDWAQFHEPKDLALSVVLEAAELIEHFQWIREKDADEYVKKHRSEIGEEMADILIYLITLSHRVGIDLLEAADKKVKKNSLKYPVKTKGKNPNKYQR